MRRRSTARAAALLFLLALNPGCGKKVVVPIGGFDQQAADEIAIQAATSLTVVGGDVELAVTTAPLAAPLAASSGARQARPASAQWDTTIVAGGITYEASRAFYDGAGGELPGYGPLAVRMRWTSRAYGTYQGPRDTASVGHDAQLDFTGIEVAQDTVTIDGVGRDTLENRFRSLDGLRVRYFYWVSSTTVGAVRQLKNPPSGGEWPLSGTVTYVVSADRLRSNSRADVEAHLDATVVVTFNGTSQPEILVNGAWRYRWNMVTGAITRA